MLRIIQQSQKELKTPVIFGNCDWVHGKPTGILILEGKYQREKKRTVIVINKLSVLLKGEKVEKLEGVKYRSEL